MSHGMPYISLNGYLICPTPLLTSSGPWWNRISENDRDWVDGSSTVCSCIACVANIVHMHTWSAQGMARRQHLGNMGNWASAWWREVQSVTNRWVLLPTPHSYNYTPHNPNSTQPPFSSPGPLPHLHKPTTQTNHICVSEHWACPNPEATLHILLIDGRTILAPVREKWGRARCWFGSEKYFIHSFLPPNWQ